MSHIDEMKRQCCCMKLKALEIALNSGTFGAHIGGSFSCMEILAALYEIANIADGNELTRDRVVLSKGHAALALYTALHHKGFISETELETFDTAGTKFHGHPHRNAEYAIDASTGSLGLGMSYAVGVGVASKKKNYGNRIFVILGDGECDEGIVWEAAMSAAHYSLNNLTVIVDYNGYQLDGETKAVMDSASLAEKFAAFGFEVDEVDGHDIAALLEVLQKRYDKPNAIIAHTVKANGISFLENNKLSHQCSLSAKKYNQAVQEIKDSYGLE